MSSEYTVGIGIDICNVKKIRRDVEREGTFVIDNFTDWEIVYCEQPRSPFVRAQRYAARFAAKEAVTKALGIDGRTVNFQDISVLKEKNGRPYIYLEGEVKTYADQLGVSRILISLAHERNIATAQCQALGNVALEKD